MRPTSRLARSGAALAAALLLGACGGGSTPAPPAPPPHPVRLSSPCAVAPLTIPAPSPGLDLAARLAALPGVSAVSESPGQPAGIRFFSFSLDRPVDHCAPSGARFSQRATLRWRSGTAPTVLATTGYGLYGGTGRTELTVQLDANQIFFEHRFFGPSAPAGLDWSRLDIFQAASDEHQLVETLRPLLTGPWLTTGASKGGMTAVYHRAFYPDDVAATVAYVAPISFAPLDARYVPFLESIGPPACREALHAAQDAVLRNHVGIEPLMAASAAGFGDGYATFGLARTLDLAALELQFVFWQYGSEAGCLTVPGAGATPQALFDFMEVVYGGGPGGTVSAWGDATLGYYAPYYYQSATQLGYPAVPQAHLLATLGGIPIVDDGAIYPPAGVTKTWDGQAMLAVDAWVRGHGDRIMFIYGGRDPWSGSQFTPSAGGEKHVVEFANHGASIAQLPAAERDAAFATIRGWLGLPAAAMAPVAARLAPISAGGEVDPLVLHARWPGR